MRQWKKSLLIFTFTWTLSTTWWQMTSVILQFQLNRDKLSLSTLRSIQGLHAPLKLQMEYRAAQQVIAPDLLTFNSCWKLAQLSFYFFCSFQIQRLPFLASSNLAVDTLRGNDDCIGFEDILNGENLIPLSYRQQSEYSFLMFVLSPCRSSSEWTDGWSTPNGGVQTGTVVKTCCIQKRGGWGGVQIRRFDLVLSRLIFVLAKNF